MAIPLTRAAKRGASLVAEPSTAAPPEPQPSDATYCWINGAVAAFEPLSASPRPSRIDFFPSSMVSGGTSPSCVLTTNSATREVSFSTLGKLVSLQVSSAPPLKAGADVLKTPRVTAIPVFLKRSLRFMSLFFLSSMPFILEHRHPSSQTGHGCLGV